MESPFDEGAVLTAKVNGRSVLQSVVRVIPKAEVTLETLLGKHDDKNPNLTWMAHEMLKSLVRRLVEQKIARSSVSFQLTVHGQPCSFLLAHPEFDARVFELYERYLFEVYVLENDELSKILR